MGEKERKQRSRQRKRDSGLVQFEGWAKAEDWAWLQAERVTRAEGSQAERLAGLLADLIANRRVAPEPQPQKSPDSERNQGFVMSAATEDRIFALHHQGFSNPVISAKLAAEGIVGGRKGEPYRPGVIWKAIQRVKSR